MGASFTEDQLGKRVVSQSGSEVGTVSAVTDGSLYVEIGEDPDAEVVDHLGWAGAVNQEVHHLNRRYISTVTEDTIRLRV